MRKFNNKFYNIKFLHKNSFNFYNCGQILNFC